MKIADQIYDSLRRIHPAQRRTIKAALRSLETGASADILPLTDALEGFYRLRAGKFRIIYRHLRDGETSCEFIDVRDTVYERFLSLREFLKE
jgi:mRNA interferase RelE/StbE